MARYFFRLAALVVAGLLLAPLLVVLQGGRSARAGHDGTNVLHLAQNGGTTDNVQLGITTLTDQATNSSPTLVVSDPGATRGIVGESTSGIGVDGGGGFAGVFGHSTGIGVHGFSEAGTAVWAQTVNGIALKVTGTSEFSRSGTVSIAARASRVIVSGVDLTSSSLVLATIQQDVPGRWVSAAVPNVAANSFTIFLNRAAANETLVAWFVVN